MPTTPADPSDPSDLSEDPAFPAYSGDTFADVKRNCHAWLMARDPAYKKSYLAGQAKRDILIARKTAKSNHNSKSILSLS